MRWLFRLLVPDAALRSPPAVSLLEEIVTRELLSGLNAMVDADLAGRNPWLQQ